MLFLIISVRKIYLTNMVNNDGLVHPVRDSTELLLQGTIDGIQRMITVHPPSPGEEGDGAATHKEPAIEISLAAKRHWELQIKTLLDAPRDLDKLRQILKAKQKEYEKTEDSEDIERLFPEIEMLKFVLFLVCRNIRGKWKKTSSTNSINSNRDRLYSLSSLHDLI